jgi:KRAB domain-containing zinc finger protein
MISISVNLRVVAVCHRVEQSVSALDPGCEPSESELCMVKEEGNMNGNINSSDSTHSRRQKMNRNEKRFQCNECSKMFTRKYHLKIHHRIHTGEKPFACTICSKGFSRNEYLALHKRTHTGEKPYKCDLCRTCFSRSDVLTKHIRTHRIRSKPFLCGICQETFSFKRALLRHKHTHRMEKRKVHGHLLEAQA